MMISIRIIIILLILLILQPGIPAAIMTNFAPITLQFSFPSFFPWNNFHLPCPSLCCCSVPQECHTLCESDPWTAALQASLSFTIFWILLKLMSIESVMSSNHLIVHCPLLFLSSIFSRHQGLFSNEFFIKCPKYWSVSFSISPSDEYSGLISFRTDWFDLFAVQGTLKSFLQHQSAKASIRWCSAFFIVQLSHNYWKTHNFD